MKQIVGGSLTDQPGELRTNFVSDRRSEWYAALYRRDQLCGGHVIMLGPGNEEAALAALAAYPGGLQVGGGITIENAQRFLDAGASHVILTSWIFHEGILDEDRLKSLTRRIGKNRLVLDLSCRWRDGAYWVVTNRWQTFTQLPLSRDSLMSLSAYCDEFLIHAVDVEGLCRGIDLQLVKQLAEWVVLPTTYAGGAHRLEDLENVSGLSEGRIDLTIGSALDIFGGTGITYQEAVEFNRGEATRWPRNWSIR